MGHASPPESEIVGAAALLDDEPPVEDGDGDADEADADADSEDGDDDDGDDAGAESGAASTSE